MPRPKPTKRRTNFYPRPPRGGRRRERSAVKLTINISIHALREEGDGPGSPACARCGNFYPRPPRGGRHEKPQLEFRPAHISIHALREEGDAPPENNLMRLFAFLSTPSARRATALFPNFAYFQQHFYPRPPRGGRLRSLLIGGSGITNFYPRPPRGGRLPMHFMFPWTTNFYPRPPRGGRLLFSAVGFGGCGFLSTPSARRATCRRLRGHYLRQISIHALREEGDAAA